jgi:hypothetical protein
MENNKTLQNVHQLYINIKLLVLKYYNFNKSVAIFYEYFSKLVK